MKRQPLLRLCLQQSDIRSFCMSALMATLLTAAASAQSTNPAERPIEVVTMAVHETDSGADLRLGLNGSPEWSTRVRADGLLELAVDAASAATISDLSFEQGTIASVRVQDRATPPGTIFEIGVRPRTSFSVLTEENGLVVRFQLLEKRVVDLAELPLPLESSVEPEPTESAGSASPPDKIQPEAADLPTPSADLPSPSVDLPFPAVAEGFEYRVGPGDVLRISVFGLADLDRKVRVSPAGTVSLPLVGTAKLSQLTVREAEESLASALEQRKLVNDPQVTIFVEEYLSLGVAVQGAVHAPGTYQMIEQRTLLEILSEAGGLLGRDGERAGQRIFVLRKTADGRQARQEIDAERLIGFGDASLNILLAPGDVVLVPPAQRLRVYVSGAVREPGAVEYLSSEGISLLQAITAAGGTTERSNLRKVFVIRQGDGDRRERIPVNLKRIRKGQDEDFLLQRNDTVIVEEWFL